MSASDLSRDTGAGVKDGGYSAINTLEYEVDEDVVIDEEDTETAEENNVRSVSSELAVTIERLS